jgi:hypothetical protein
MRNESNLTMICENDGFSPVAPTDQVIIGTRLKFTDGKWSTADAIEMPTGRKLLAYATDTVLQKWSGQRADTIREKPLPDLNMLNEAIPKNQWELDLNGQPRPPWAVYFIVYLLDPRNAEQFTYINCTTGTRIAVQTLQDRVASMRIMRDANVIAVVELASRPMKTKFGLKQRPHFEIVDWCQAGGPETPKLTKVSGPTPGEELDDDIPF